MAQMADSGAPVRPGDVLAGKYRVDRVLGAGGMGVVVAATHLQLDQHVALKFLLPWALTNQLAVERFSREAKAAVRLKSDHVARVTDVGFLESGSPYLVMEYLEGIDLHDLIHQPNYKVPVGDAVDFILQACDAVAEAHALGIVHRDLKPRNLFMTRGNDGRPLVKVLDFGISKVATQPGDMSLTRTAEIIGSPNYMSPEQLKASRDVDGRTDIWAIGVILYELLGGDVPFVAETLTQLTALVLTEMPRPLKELRPDLPPGLIQVVGKCLEKDVTKRFQSVAALAGGLAKFAPEHARGLAEKVRLVQDASRSPMSVVALPTKTGPGGGTSVAWGATEYATGSTTTRARKGFVWVGAIGALGVLALAAGGVYVFMHKAHDGATSPAVAAAGPASAVPPPAAPPPSPGVATNAPAATQSPQATAQAATPPPASATPAAATKPAGGTKPHGTTKSGTHQGSTNPDDMPSDRL